MWDLADGDGEAFGITSGIACGGEDDRDGGTWLDGDFDGIETVFCARLCIPRPSVIRAGERKKIIDLE